MRLLVCDDDHSIGRFLRSIFSAGGWTVEYVDRGDACLAAAAASPPDAIVLDQMMPGKTGVETARELRARGYTNPIILFSAYLGPDVDAAVGELGVQPVSKIDTQALLDTIEGLAGARA